MALIQQERPVRRALRSPPRVSVGRIVYRIAWYLRSPNRLGGPWECFWGPGDQEESGEGSVCPREVPGGS